MTREETLAQRLVRQPRVFLAMPGRPAQGRQVVPGGLLNSDRMWVREATDPDVDDSYYPVSISELQFII